jgi:hypothetical protein
VQSRISADEAANWFALGGLPGAPAGISTGAVAILIIVMLDIPGLTDG